MFLQLLNNMYSRYSKHTYPHSFETGLRKCLEGIQLVGLPVKGGRSQATGASAEEGEDAWDAWDGDGDAEEATTEREKSTIGGSIGGNVGDDALGLWEVEKRLFADNQSAREVLDALGIELLTEAEARAVLGKRVELAG